MSSQIPQDSQDLLPTLSPALEVVFLAFLMKGVQFFETVQPLAERLMETQHFWNDPKQRTMTQREELEARAIVLAATMPKPSYGKIAKMLEVPKSTLSGWPELKKAFDARFPRTGTLRRGVHNSDGTFEAVDED